MSHFVFYGQFAPSSVLAAKDMPCHASRHMETTLQAGLMRRDPAPTARHADRARLHSAVAACL